jgi:hypothetical protein
MSYLDWHVGMRVVCINDDWTWVIRHDDGGELPVRVPMLNEVLEIAHMRAGDGSDLGGREDKIYLGFSELDYQSDGNISADQFGWDASQFRPLETCKTDISVFEKMLTGSKQKEPV